MGKLEEDGEFGIQMRGWMDLNGQPEADKASMGVEMMHRRAQRGDPEAALHVLNHVVPDILADEADQS